MAAIRVIFGNGEPGRVVAFHPLEAPFQHDGRPGSRRKVLHEDPQRRQVIILVQWDAGYHMAELEHHHYDEHIYVLAGTFDDGNRACGPGAHIYNRADSRHLAQTSDGCAFLEIVTGR